MRKSAQLEKKAEAALRAIERAFNVSITLHDLRGTICHPGGNVALPSRHRHRHRCCVHGRVKNSEWDKLCFKNCFTVIEMDASRKVRPFCKRCWKGVVELVVPLHIDGRHQFTIYAGAFRANGAKPQGKPFDDDRYLELFNSLPRLPGSQWIDELGALLGFWGKGLLHSLQSQTALPDVSRGHAIRRFLEAAAHQDVGLRDLAAELHLSPSRTSHAVREYTGLSFNALLLKVRMERAAGLLKQSRDSLAEIALKLGFKNEFYFNRVFKKFYGMPPGSFRNGALRERRKAT